MGLNGLALKFVSFIKKRDFLQGKLPKKKAGNGVMMISSYNGNNSVQFIAKTWN